MLMGTNLMAEPKEFSVLPVAAGWADCFIIVQALLDSVMNSNADSDKKNCLYIGNRVNRHDICPSASISSRFSSFDSSVGGLGAIHFDGVIMMTIYDNSKF